MKRSREPEEHLEPLEDSLQGEYRRSAETDVDLRPVTKIAELDSAVEDEDSFAMRCSLPPHKEPLGFRSYGDYEAHYVKFHTNRCLECRKNFPTDHLLIVHIEECHDPLAKVARDKGEHTYSCFVEGCERKCMTPQKRRLHLIDKHMYPKNFFFAVTKNGIDGRRSLLLEGGHHRRKSSSSTQTKETRRRSSTLEKIEPKPVDEVKKEESKPDEKEAEPETKTVDTDMADLASAMSALQFVPPSIRFGRGRAGFSKR